LAATAGGTAINGEDEAFTLREDRVSTVLENGLVWD
jgi:hypothetical protein